MPEDDTSLLGHSFPKWNLSGILFSTTCVTQVIRISSADAATLAGMDISGVEEPGQEGGFWRVMPPN